MSIIDSVLSMPQEAAMLLLGGIAAVIHYGCCMLRNRRCEPGKLLLFAGSAAGMVAGIYVFIQALHSTLAKTQLTLSYQNAVWAGIGGICVSLFTLDFMITELRILLAKDQTAIVTPIAIKPDEQEKSKDLDNLGDSSTRTVTD